VSDRRRAERLHTTTILTMGTLYLVRHGQASFGAADYDQLSDLGQRQCHALGQYFAARSIKFDAVLVGTLRRHTQSLHALAEGLGQPLPEALPWPGLNEYDGEALVRAVLQGPAPDAHSAEGYRQHFRLLREGMTQWIAGAVSPAGMPTYTAWAAGITSALDHVRQHHGQQLDAKVLLVSSGGPISTMVGHVLGTPPQTTIELNLRIRNSSLTELAFTPKRHMLLSYNHLPHLDDPQRASWQTYS